MAFFNKVTFAPKRRNHIATLMEGGIKFNNQGGNYNKSSIFLQASLQPIIFAQDFHQLGSDFVSLLSTYLMSSRFSPLMRSKR